VRTVRKLVVCARGMRLSGCRQHGSSVLKVFGGAASGAECGVAIAWSCLAYSTLRVEYLGPQISVSQKNRELTGGEFELELHCNNSSIVRLLLSQFDVTKVLTHETVNPVSMI
jgi:hypothetical protein